MKAIKGLLKLIGAVMVAAGAVLVGVSYLDEIKALFERCKTACCRRSHSCDYDPDWEL